MASWKPWFFGATGGTGSSAILAWVAAKCRRSCAASMLSGCDFKHRTHQKGIMMHDHMLETVRTNKCLGFQSMHLSFATGIQTSGFRFLQDLRARLVILLRQQGQGAVELFVLLH